MDVCELIAFVVKVLPDIFKNQKGDESEYSGF